MTDFDRLRTIRYRDAVIAFDIFWIKSDGCVYMICPVFLQEFSAIVNNGSFDIWVMKNTPFVRLTDAVSSMTLRFKGREIEAEVIACVDACVLVRFDGIHSDGSISVEFGCVVNGEKVNYSLELPENPHRRVHLTSEVIVFNAHSVINDWLYWHKNIGVERFLLYDNKSEHNTYEEVTKGYEVIFIPWHFPFSWDVPQDYSYEIEGRGTFFFISSSAGQETHAIYKYKETSDWITNTSVDEYIMPYQGLTLNEDMAFLLIDNIYYKTGKENTWGRVYEKYLYREAMENLISPYKQKVIVNTDKIQFGDFMLIHAMRSMVRQLPYETLDRYRSARMNHYRGILKETHQPKCHDDILNVRDDIMKEIARDFK